MKYDIYLAAPFFTENELDVYHKVVKELRQMGYKVFVPQEHEIENGWKMSNRDWAQRVFNMDILGLADSGCLVCLNFGMYSDSGTAWEVGYAKGCDMKVVQVLCGDENTVYSLMMINGSDIICDLNNISIDHTTVDLRKVIQK